MKFYTGSKEKVEVAEESMRLICSPRFIPNLQRLLKELPIEITYNTAGSGMPYNWGETIIEYHPPSLSGERLDVSTAERIENIVCSKDITEPSDNEDRFEAKFKDLFIRINKKPIDPKYFTGLMSRTFEPRKTE